MARELMLPSLHPQSNCTLAHVYRQIEQLPQADVAAPAKSLPLHVVHEAAQHFLH